MAAPLGGALVVVGPVAAGRAPRTCPRSAGLGSSRWSGAGSEGAGVVEELAGVSVVRKSL